jgi:hypothetical protein
MSSLFESMLADNFVEKMVMAAVSESDGFEGVSEIKNLSECSKSVKSMVDRCHRVWRFLCKKRFANYYEIKLRKRSEESTWKEVFARQCRGVTQREIIDVRGGIESARERQRRC